MRLMRTYTVEAFWRRQGLLPAVRHLLGQDPARCATEPLRDVPFSPAITVSHRVASDRRQGRPPPVLIRGRVGPFAGLLFWATGGMPAPGCDTRGGWIRVRALLEKRRQGGASKTTCLTCA